MPKFIEDTFFSKKDLESDKDWPKGEAAPSKAKDVIVCFAGIKSFIRYTKEKSVAGGYIYCKYWESYVA